MATELDTESFLSLADLTNLPFADESLSVILNIFTPSNYAEFHRVLTENGGSLKLFLTEIIYVSCEKFINFQLIMIIKQLLSVFKEEFPKNTQQTIDYTFEIPENLRQDFLLMSPLEWSVSEERKKNLQRKIRQKQREFMCKF